MNTPSPLLPQGALSKSAPKGGSKVLIVVSTIVAVHLVGFGLVLMQGCGRAKKGDGSLADTNSLPTLGTTETNAPYFAANTNTYADSLLSTNGVQRGTNAPGFRDYGYLPPATNPPAPLPANTYEPAPERSTSAAASEYKIKKGDTLGKIAKANGVSLKALSEANPNLDPAKLKIGQAVTIPAAAARSATSSGAKTPSTSAATPDASGKMITHKVKAGDTLTKIAHQYGTTAAKIREANGMKTTRLVINKELKIPASTKTAPPAR